MFSRVSQLLAARHILSSIFADRHKSSKRRASCSVHILLLFLRKAGIDRWKTVVVAHNSVFLPPVVVDPSHSGPLFTHSWIDPDPYKPYSFRISSIFFCSTSHRNKEGEREGTKNTWPHRGTSFTSPRINSFLPFSFHPPPPRPTKRVPAHDFNILRSWETQLLDESWLVFEKFSKLDFVPRILINRPCYFVDSICVKDFD